LAVNFIDKKGFRKYFYNTGWLFIEQFLRLLVNFYITILLARQLGPSEYGLFSYIVSVYSIFAVIATLGLDNVLVRELLHDKSRYEIYLGTSFWLKFVGAIFTLCVLSVYICLYPSSFVVNICIYILSIGLFFNTYEVINYFFKSKVEAKYVSLSRIIQLSVSSVLKIIFLLSNAEIIWLVVIVVIDNITYATVLYFVYIKKKYKKFYRYFDLDIAKGLLKSSWPMVITAVAISVFMRIDLVMIGNIMSKQDVGVYSVAVNIYNAWVMIPVTITLSLLPAIINSKKNSEVLYYSRLEKLFRLIVWLSIFVAGICFVFADYAVILLFGGEYAKSADVLKITMLSGVFAAMGSGMARYLVVENWEKKIAFRNIIAAVLNIAFNMYMIPKYGVMGASYATLICLFIANYGLDFIDSDLRRILIIKNNSLNPLRLIKDIRSVLRGI